MTKSWITAVLCCSFASAPLIAQPRTEIFSIGVRDNTFVEFSRDENRNGVLYKVGGSSAEKDWPAYQPGSFDVAVARSTMQEDWTTASPTPTPRFRYASTCLLPRGEPSSFISTPSSVTGVGPTHLCAVGQR